MSRSQHTIVFIQQYVVMVVKQTLAGFVYIWSKKTFRAANGYPICAASPLATCSCRSKEVIIPPTPPDVSCLHKRSCNLAWLSTLLYMQAIGSQFYTVNAMKRTEEKVFLTSVFNIKGVNAVLNANLLACKHTSAVDKGTGRIIAHSNANTCIPFPAPY